MHRRARSRTSGRSSAGAAVAFSTSPTARSSAGNRVAPGRRERSQTAPWRARGSLSMVLQPCGEQAVSGPSGERRRPLSTGPQRCAEHQCRDERRRGPQRSNPLCFGGERHAVPSQRRDAQGQSEESEADSRRQQSGHRHSGEQCEQGATHRNGVARRQQCFRRGRNREQPTRSPVVVWYLDSVRIGRTDRGCEWCGWCRARAVAGVV